MKILFVGELYPYVVHGISISNYINCELLAGEVEIDTIEEKTSLNSQ